MKTIHLPKKLTIGIKVGRLREILGIKQEYMALELGVNQQRISRMEKKKQIDPITMQRIAEIYGMSVAAIENFNEEFLIDYIKNSGQPSPGPHNKECNCAETLQKAIDLYEQMLQMQKENPNNSGT